MPVTQQLSEISHQFRKNWRQFLAIHVGVNALVFIILGPLAGLLLHLAVTLSGEAALSDQDILFFLLRPEGLASLLLTGSVFSVIVFLEQAALMIAARYGGEPQAISSRWLLGFIAKRLTGLFSLSVRILLRVLLVILLFLLLLLVVYRAWLGEYDINYYLSERPPEFMRAAVAGSLITLALVFVLMRLFINWVFCLPLLLINGFTPAQALNASSKAARGHRVTIGAWLAGWLLFSMLIAAAVTALISVGGNLMVPLALNSLNKLLAVLSLLSVLAIMLNFLVTWLSNCFLTLLILALSSEIGIELNVTEPPRENDPWRMGWLFGRRNLALGLLAGLVLAAFVINGLLDRVQMADRTEIMAHRGASAVAPENTIAAIRAAMEAGAHWVEIDVQETADDEIVIIHDGDLKKIAGRPIRVAESSLEELQQADIGSWFDPGFSAERIPTLQQVLALCKGRIGVNIELKYYGRERRLEESVVEIVEAAGMQEQVLVMSLNYEGIKRMRQLRPGWTLGLLSSVAVGNLLELDVDFLAINAKAASRARISKTQDGNKQIMVWTVNDAIGMSTMISRGVDAIITDEPALAVSILQQRAEMEPAQRLLMYLADVFDQPALYQDQ